MNSETFYLHDAQTQRERRKMIFAVLIKNLVANLRTIMFDFVPIAMLLRSIGIEQAMPLLKSFAFAQLSMNLTILLPLKGLNSSLDTLISNAAGQTRTDGKQIELCGMYLRQARFFTTLCFGPCVVFFLLLRAQWQTILEIHNSSDSINNATTIKQATNYS